MKLIIQSDDLGITEAVSCGIARAAREGAITCTGLVSNMPASVWEKISTWWQDGHVQIQRRFRHWFRRMALF